MQDINTTFENARNNKLKSTDRLFCSNETTKPTDNYGNTLLHIMTEHENEEYVEKLLNGGYSQELTNKFGKSPWDIAINNRNKKIINKFVAHKVEKATQNVKEQNNVLIQNKSQLEETIKTLKVNNKKLAHIENAKNETITQLTKNQIELCAEITNLKSDNNVLQNANKRIREENTELTNANKKLRIAVDSFLS